MEKAMLIIRSAVFALMLAAFAIKPAAAQVTVDVAKITCEQYVLYKIADPREIAMWLSGFYNGKRNNTILDPTKLNEQAEKLKNFCIINGKMTVMDAVAKVILSAK